MSSPRPAENSEKLRVEQGALTEKVLLRLVCQSLLAPTRNSLRAKVDRNIACEYRVRSGQSNGLEPRTSHRLDSLKSQIKYNSFCIRCWDGTKIWTAFVGRALHDCPGMPSPENNPPNRGSSGSRAIDYSA